MSGLAAARVQTPDESAPSVGSGGRLGLAPPGGAAAIVEELRRKLAAQAPRQTGNGLGTHGRPIATGIGDLDAALHGGLPRGKLVEAIGSTGKMSLALLSLAGATQRGELTAFIDAADALDPGAAQRLGVDLKRVLWVRTGDGGIPAALKAADLLLGAGGFGLIVVYLCGAPPPPRPAEGARVTAAAGAQAFARLQQRCEKAQAAVLVVADQPQAGSFATTTLRCAAEAPIWERAPGGRLRLHAQRARVEVARSRLGPPGDAALLTLRKYAPTPAASVSGLLQQAS